MERWRWRTQPETKNMYIYTCTYHVCWHEPVSTQIVPMTWMKFLTVNTCMYIMVYLGVNLSTLHTYIKKILISSVYNDESGESTNHKIYHRHATSHHHPYVAVWDPPHQYV